MYIIFATNGVGSLMTDNGIHDVTAQLANLFRRSIRADQNKDVPDTVLPVEKDMMRNILRLMKNADRADTSIDAVKLAAALSDALGKTLDVDAEIDPTELATALEAASGRIARAMLKAQGEALSNVTPK